MATISIDIPAGTTQRVLDGVAGQYGYKGTIPDPANPGQTIPNPVTKAVFAKQVVQNFVKDTVKAWEANKDAETARLAAISKAESEIVIT